jgi:hypothetical protein
MVTSIGIAPGVSRGTNDSAPEPVNRSAFPSALSPTRANGSVLSPNWIIVTLAFVSKLRTMGRSSRPAMNSTIHLDPFGTTSVVPGNPGHSGTFDSVSTGGESSASSRNPSAELAESWSTTVANQGTRNDGCGCTDETARRKMSRERPSLGSTPSGSEDAATVMCVRNTPASESSCTTPLTRTGGPGIFSGALRA